MGWEQLRAVGKEAAELRDEDNRRRPTACPNDGEPLREGPDGQLFCIFDGWREQQ